MNTPSEIAAEILIADDLEKHARKLALTKDPIVRIVASRWQLQFQQKLAELRHQEQQQQELFSIVDHADDEEHAKVAED